MIYINRNELPRQLQHLHTTGLIRLYPQTEVTIPMDAGLWSGGTRRLFDLVDLQSGQTTPVTWHNTSPWHADRKECRITLQPGQAIVESGSFCGKPAGLHFYLHPSNAAALLPARPSLSAECQALVNITCGFKAPYRADEWRRRGYTTHQWQQAREEALQQGLILASGAITTKGRNART